VRLDQVRQEEGYLNGRGRTSKESKTYQDAYAACIKRQETRAKALRKEQKGIKEKYTDNVEQRAQFSALRSLLDAKLNILKDEKERAMKASVDEYAALGLGGGGDNRMTFD
jgi:hypothetical protein